MTTDKKSGCLALLASLFGAAPKPSETAAEQTEPLPYHLRDDFLSPAELNFYRVLQQVLGDTIVICPMCGLSYSEHMVVSTHISPPEFGISL